MSRLDFGFALFEYSVAVFALGMVVAVLLRSSERGWPTARKPWAYSLLFTCTAALCVIIVIRFVAFVRQ